METATRDSDTRERVCRLAEESVRADDPESALRMVTELRRELDALVAVQVRRSLAAGSSFGEVARALGISRQAAHRRYRELAPGAQRRPVATEQARRVVRCARAETVAAGAPAAGSREVLLGILRADCDAARALRSEGVTLEKARTCAPLVDSAGGGAGDSSCLERIVRRAGHLAVARGDEHVTPAQLLLAAIADADGGARGILAALGVSPLAIRARLGC